MEVRSSERHDTMKTRSFLSPLHSDYTASQSYSASQSTEHVKMSRPHSISKSGSSRAHSSSSKSKSGSMLHYSRTKRSESRARLSSHTSLSVSLSQPLLSSSNKAQQNLKGSSDNATTPESKVLLIELEQPLEGDSGLGDKTVENRMVAENNKYGVPPSKAEIEMKKDSEDHPMASGSLHKVTNLSKIAAEERGTIDSPKSLAEIVCQNSDEFIIEHVPVPMKNPDSEPLVSSCSSVSKSISSEELSMVLRHYYGPNLQCENERHLPADVYFGSARLWPWKVIYYRRLKKGPTSIENYARHVYQNREFGIVDKYIRSSSG